MNQLPGRNERDAFDEALPAIFNGRTEQESGALSLSGTHKQSSPFLNAASQFGAKVVQFAVKPVIDYDVRNPVISKKVLAALAGDPDPATTLTDIRKLLVGPTHKLHDAMFEEVITILEESDREVQDALESLDSRCIQLSHVTDELVSSSVENRDQNRIQIELLQKDIQNSVAAQQEMLTEMFLAIDTKIEELAAQVNQKVEALSKKIEADMREGAANQERKMLLLEANCLASSKEAANLLENRLAHLENSAGSEGDVLREVFADGLLNLADRFKALHQS
jgi:hypothetical protein